MSAQQRHRLFVSHTVCLLAKGVSAATLNFTQRWKKIRKSGQDRKKRSCI